MLIALLAACGPGWWLLVVLSMGWGRAMNLAQGGTGPWCLRPMCILRMAGKLLVKMKAGHGNTAKRSRELPWRLWLKPMFSLVWIIHHGSRWCLWSWLQCLRSKILWHQWLQCPDPWPRFHRLFPLRPGSWNVWLLPLQNPLGLLPLPL